MYNYPLTLVREVRFWYAASCPLLPELRASGASVEAVLRSASLNLPTVLEERIRKGLPIPLPDADQPEGAVAERVALAAPAAIKVMLWRAMHERGVTLEQMAERLGCPSGELLHRLGMHRSDAGDELEEAFAALGLRLTLATEPL